MNITQEILSNIVVYNKYAKYLNSFDFDKKYYINDLIKGDVIFCATGVTDGELVKGIKDQGSKFSCETYVTHKSSNTSTIYREVFEK